MPHTASLSYSRRRGRFALVAGLLAGLLVLPAAAQARHDRSMDAAAGGNERGPELSAATHERKLLFDKRGALSLHYRIRHDRPVDVKVKLIAPNGEGVVKRWKRSSVRSGTHRIRWAGSVDGAIQDEGRYRFQVVAKDGNGGRSVSSRGDGRDGGRFRFWHHKFPIPGRYDYGSSGARFGAPRSHGGHQGQDVFADCGKRLLAVRGGRVEFSGYQSAAGHYIVISGRKSRVDSVYMHLQRRPRLDAGDRVRTGEQIGRVGESGNAVGCHLHFELWDSPGWYKGGSPYDPLPFLQHWGSYS